MKYLVAGALFMGLLVSCGGDDKKEQSEETPTTVEVKSVGELTIGYYDLDSIATGFSFYKETQARLEKKGKQIEDRMNAWQQKGQKAAIALQAGMQNQTLTENQVIAYQKKIQECENKIIQIQQNELEPFQQENFEMNQVLTNKVDAYGRDFSKKHALKLFFSVSKGGTVAYVDSTFNMTTEFINYMNEREKQIDADTE
jgi:Skp family chaperone for outer membrane proteins